ncbi:MAG TPA: biosynthetic peptidoglycan transglycosylase, partial [Candidatus Xenobia bacterium]
MTRRRRWILGVGGLVVLLALGFWAVPVPSEALKQGVAPSLRLTDRHGTVLREFLSSDEGTSAWVDLDRISPDLVTCTLAAEDHRFWSHLGVDPIGVLRAAVGNARAGHVVSGASTLAMQWIGNATNHHPRTLGGKAWQGLQAMRLMTMLSRRELLERYLNTVPYGHQTFGAEAAARFYFNRSANSLSLAQCAWLAAIPAAPAYFDGLAEPDRVRGRERDILAALQALGWVP